MYTLLAMVTSDICALQRRGQLNMNVGVQETTSNYATRIDFDRDSEETICSPGGDGSGTAVGGRLGRRPDNQFNDKRRWLAPAAVPRFYLIRILIWQP